MAQTRMAICLCDPHQDDLPIVFANRAFRALTGYSEDEIIGNNCRFLQGADTDPEAVDRLRDAIRNEDVVVVELLNYRKDGTSFWNALHLGPIYDDEGKLVYFFGSQWDVSDVRAARSEERHAREMARELSHRMKNMFAVISGIINVTGRLRGFQDQANEINQRIQALGRAYETTLDDASRGSIDIGEAIRAVLRPYSVEAERIVFKGSDVQLAFGAVSLIGLILHELAANATRHGAWSNDEGLVTIDWYADEDRDCFVIDWSETGGPPVDPAGVEDGTGSAIVDRLLKSSDGQIERQWNDHGLHAVVSLPMQGVT